MTLSRRDLLALGGMTLAGTTLNVSAARAQAPKRGGTLVLRGWDPPLFDPMLQTAYRVQIPITFTHSRLVKHKAGPSVAPATFPIEGDLAESWTPAERDDVRLQAAPGRAVASQAAGQRARARRRTTCVYSVERFLTVKGNANAYMLALDRQGRGARHVHGASSRSRSPSPGSSTCSPTRWRWPSSPRSASTSSATSRRPRPWSAPALDARQLPAQRRADVRPQPELLRRRPALHRPDRGRRRRGQRLAHGRLPLRQVRPRLGDPGHHQPDGLGADQGHAQAEAAEPAAPPSSRPTS